MKGLLTNPVQTLGYLGVLSIIGLIVIGVLTAFITIKDTTIVDKIVDVFSIVLYTAVGAKSALSQYRLPPEDTDQNLKK